MDRIKIVGIVGSLRLGSYNRQLALLAGSLLGDGVDYSLLDYSDIPFFNQDIEYPAPSSVVRVRDIVKSADGVWFFSPEYNHFFPGVLKNLLDWLSRPVSKDVPQVLSGKPVAVSGLSLGMSGAVVAQDHLVSLLSVLDMRVMNKPRLSVPNALQQTDASGNLSLSVSVPFLELQVAAFPSFIKNVCSLK